MKSAISSDVWEKKKAQIARLYMEEEWPLKQVIKQMRSDDFNPSETQLRSRLKKWRVIKPSRQTRKKPQTSSSSGDDQASEKNSHGPSPAPQKDPGPSPSATDVPTTVPVSHPAYAPPEVSPRPILNQPHSLRSKPLALQLSPISPSVDYAMASGQPPPIQTFSARNGAYSPSTQQTSPVCESLMINTTSTATPSYPNAGYPLSPESCLPSPGAAPTRGMAWPARSMSIDLGLGPGLTAAEWFSMPFESITPPPVQSQSNPPMCLPMSGGPLMVPQHGYLSDFPQYGGDMPEYANGYDESEPWGRTMSLQYDGPPHHAMERKPDQAQSQPSGPNAVMCAPIYSYMGHEHPVQNPGIGY